MKASELRIGNILYYGDPLAYINPVYFKIKGGYSIDAVESGIDVRPIPLTGDWLVKFGFEKIDSFKDWTKRNHVLKSKDFNFPVYDHKNINMYFHSLNGNNYFFYNGVDISVDKMPYLHQIQNLYFALTGEELTIE